MENVIISEIVSISPSYTSEVNIEMDFADEEMNANKVKGYIPTAPARQAIKEIVQGLNPGSSERVHLVTGMYGSGKSHFGLMLANLFGRPPDDQLLEPFMAKLRDKDPEAAKIVSRNRSAIQQPFLIVILRPTAVPGGFNYALLSALQTALKRAGIDYQFKTQFSDAVGVLDHLATKDKSRLEQELQKQQTDLQRLRANLKELKPEALDKFQAVYKAMAYMPFHPEHFADPVQVYQEVVRYLRSSAGLAGIFIIADEFGRYLSEIARDPESRESSDIQRFLEFCKRTREDQVHFLVIVHKTLADYAVGYRSKADWDKVAGRFIGSEYNLTMVGGDYEIVDMIDAVIHRCVDTPERQALWQRVEASLGSIKDWVGDAKLFTGQSETWIQNVLLAGCYPLHPASTFCLPWLAQRAGQASRTAFKFLESTEPGGLQAFIESTQVFSDSGGLNLYPPDRLMAYFEQGARERLDYHATMAARDAALAVCGGNPLAARLIDLLAILEIVAQPSLQPKREVLTALIATTRAEEPEVAGVIDTLATQRVIRFRPTTGRYELPRAGTGEIDAQEAILRVKDGLRESFNLVSELTRWTDATPMGRFTSSLTAHKYEEKHGIRRTAVREFISPSHLNNLEAYRNRIKEWYSPKRGAYQGDALILYVIAESEGEIHAVRSVLSAGTGSDQLIVAVPKQPFTAGEAVLDLVAIRYIRNLGLKLGNETVDVDDLERVQREKEDQVEETLRRYLAASNFEWHYGKSIVASIPENGEEDLVSDILLTVFDKTPPIRDEALADSTGRDKQKKYRLHAMRQLLEVDGPIQLMKSGGQANERMLRAALYETGLLEKGKDLGKAAEYQVRPVAPPSSPLAEIWDDLRKLVTTPGDPVRLDEPIRKLLAPPYGLTPQLLELLLAAVLRTVKDQCVIFGKSGDGLEAVSLVADRIPDLISRPEDYVLLYYEVLPAQRAFLTELIEQLAPDAKSEPGGLWERAKNALWNWFTRLPPVTRQATDLSPIAQAVSRLLTDEDKLKDAKRLLSVDLPEAFGVQVTPSWTEQSPEQLLSAFRSVYGEFESYIQRHSQILIEYLCDLFGTAGRTSADLDEATRDWFSELEAYQRLRQFTGDAGALVEAIKAEGGVIDRFLVQLPQAMLLRPYSEWVESSAIDLFKLRVRVAKHEVETWTPPSGPGPGTPPGPVENPIEATRRQIRLILDNSGLEVDAQIQILNELLAEMKE